MRIVNVIAVLILLGATSRATTLPVQQALSETDGLRAIRIVLSTEANVPFGPKKGFGTLAEVLKVAGTAVPAKTVDPNTASIRDYTLRITRSSDKKRFEATLTPTTGCGPSWFGNERNIIYTGKPLGC
jgi:hypothetical protein